MGSSRFEKAGRLSVEDGKLYIGGSFSVEVRADIPEGAVPLELSDGSVIMGEMGDCDGIAFEVVDGTPLPAYQQIGDKLLSGIFSAKVDGADAVVFDKSFFGVNKLVGAAQGDFNGDGFVDLALTMSDPDKGTLTYILHLDADSKPIEIQDGVHRYQFSGTYGTARHRHLLHSFEMKLHNEYSSLDDTAERRKAALQLFDCLICMRKDVTDEWISKAQEIAIRLAVEYSLTETIESIKKIRGMLSLMDGFKSPINWHIKETYADYFERYYDTNPSLLLKSIHPIGTCASELIKYLSAVAGILKGIEDADKLQDAIDLLNVFCSNMSQMSDGTIYKFKTIVVDLANSIPKERFSRISVSLHGALSSYDRMASACDTIIAVLETALDMREEPQFIYNFGYNFAETDCAVAYGRSLTYIRDSVKDRRTRTRAYTMLDRIHCGKFRSPEVIAELADTIVLLCKKMSIEDMAVINFAVDTPNEYLDSLSAEEASWLSIEFHEIATNFDGDELLIKLYELFKGSDEISPLRLREYAPLLEYGYRDMRMKDILAAEASIGAEGAKKLYDKFNIRHFARLHPSILNELVELADDPGKDRDKPYVLVNIAEQDDSGWFDWGSKVPLDDDIRIIPVEVATKAEYVDLNRRMVETYGVPDVWLHVAHGLVDSFNLSEGESISTLDQEWLVSNFGDLFEGHVPPQIVFDSCFTGGDAKSSEAWFALKKEKKQMTVRRNKGPLPNGTPPNIAIMYARTFKTETIAPRSYQGFLFASIVKRDGHIRIDPLFIEIDPPYGFSRGTRYTPDSASADYPFPADYNTGMSAGIAASYEDRGLHLELMGGWKEQYFEFLRLGADLAVDLDFSSGDVDASMVIGADYVAFSPFAISTRARFGFRGVQTGIADPLLGFSGGLNIFLEPIGSELYLMYSHNIDGEGGLSIRFEKRF